MYVSASDSIQQREFRYVEDSAIAFAMYCDENGLTLQEGRDLAERIGGELENTADDRISYLPPEKVEADA